MVLLASGCSADSPFSGCERCLYDEFPSDLVCARDTNGREIACTSLCDVDQPECDPGRACLPYPEQPNTFACSVFCEDSLCPEREICSGSELGECVGVECAEGIPCLDASAVCDERLQVCYPSNGRCETSIDCPAFELDDSVERDCVDGFCSVLDPAESLPPSLNPDGDLIEISSPTAGRIFENQDDILFSWDPQQFGVVLLVLDAPATSVQVMRQSAIWTAGVSAEAEASAAWSDGVGRLGSEWLSQPTPVPVETTLYFALVAYDGSEIRAASKVVPFRVASDGWPASSGDPCSNEGELRGDCDAPNATMVCQAGLCRVLCLSNADCTEYDLDCGPVIDGVRTCR